MNKTLNKTLLSIFVLSGPEKSVTGEEVLSQLLNEELESKVTLTRRPPPSPAHPLRVTHSLTPLRKAHRPTGAQCGVPLKSSSVFLNKWPLSDSESPLSPAKDDSTRSAPSRTQTQSFNYVNSTVTQFTIFSRNSKLGLGLGIFKLRDFH